MPSAGLFCGRHRKVNGSEEAVRSVTSFIKNATLRDESLEWPQCDYSIGAILPFAWIALALPQEISPDESVDCFPVLIDTGSNQSLSMRQEVLETVFGTHDNIFEELQRNLDSLHQQSPRRSNRGPYFFAPIDAFLFRSRVDAGRPVADKTRYTKLSFDEGISVYPPPTSYDNDGLDPRPSVPCLGMRAIVDNELRFFTRGSTYSLNTKWSW